MKIVVLDRSSVGEDVSVAPFEKYGEVVLYSNTVAAEAAERVKDADVVILLSPRGKGTHTEFGMALAWGKKVYLCHGDDSLFRGDENTSTFYCLPQVHRLVGDTEAIARQVLEG